MMLVRNEPMALAPRRSIRHTKDLSINLVIEKYISTYHAHHLSHLTTSNVCKLTFMTTLFVHSSFGKRELDTEKTR